jgi:general secretion pathway protein G
MNPCVIPTSVSGEESSDLCSWPARSSEWRKALSHRHHSRQPGFTLLELIVVIIVLALLAGLVAPQIFGRLSEAKSTTAKTQIELFGTALDNYRLDNGAYPTTEQGLEALRVKPAQGPLPLNWRGPYLRKAVPLDPWGRAYIYRSPGERNPGGYDLSSLGRDGKAGGADEDADVIGQG